MANDPLQPLAQPTSAGFAEIANVAALPHLRAVRVIDVREVDEFNGPLGHIASAELVPLATVPVAAAGWDREAPILLVCRSGGRSGRAAATLAQAGFSRLYNLTGGMLAWNEAALPVTRH